MKKPKTIAQYQKKIKDLKKHNKVYESTLAYLVDSKDDTELIGRVKEYRKILGIVKSI